MSIDCLEMLCTPNCTAAAGQLMILYACARTADLHLQWPRLLRPPWPSVFKTPSIFDQLSNGTYTKYQKKGNTTASAGLDKMDNIY